MADMMAAGASFLADSLAAHVSQEVTYRRGGKEITGLLATRGAPLREVAQDGTNIVSLKWFIKPSLLAYVGTEWTPQKNDVIEESNGAQWTVVPTENESEAVLGSFGEMWLIDTKRIKRPD